MAPINPSGFASVSVSQSDNLTVKLLATRPVAFEILATPVAPGRLVGYFNPEGDFVELYVASQGGNYYLRVGA